MLGLLDVGRQHWGETRLACFNCGLGLVAVSSRWHYQDAIIKAKLWDHQKSSPKHKSGKCKVMLD